MNTKNKKLKNKNKKINTNKKKSLEIKVFLFFSIIILLILSYSGILGIFGKWLSGIFFAIFGTIFYTIPIILATIFILNFINSSKYISKKYIKKYILLVIILISISILCELLFNYKFSFNDSLYNNFEFHKGGGIIGFGFSNIFIILFSIYGAILITSYMLIISLFYLFEYPIFSIIFNYIKSIISGNNRKIVLDKKNNSNEDKEDIHEVLIKQDKDIDKVLNKLILSNENDNNKLVDKIIPTDENKISNDYTTNIINDADTNDLNIPYNFPSINLLKKNINTTNIDNSSIRNMAITLKNTLDSFGVKAEISNISIGPSVTRFEIVPDIGVKVSRIVNLSDDIKLNLAAKEIRIEAPIPGKAAIGIEIPNNTSSMVRFRDLVETTEFVNAKSKLSFCVGMDIEGKPVITDIQKMPHVLIAGATGSGKSVCINTLIMSILYKSTPDDVKLMMIDPKVVELSIYNGIPHLLIPVVTDPKHAASALNWAVSEMDKRYKLFASKGVKDIFGYNTKLLEDGEKKMPQILIIIDELADLMMVASNEVENSICRIAQLARACGIHLVIATQRPSVNVITGVIKANIPSRIAFAVSSGVDSRTIIDMNGAEKLLGKGDMLFHPSGLPNPVRLQGAFIGEDEISKVVNEISVDNTDSIYSKEVEEKIENNISNNTLNNEYDEYFYEAGKIIIDKDRASIGILQRLLRIGFNRASRIMDQLYEAGVVGADEGTKPRKVLMNMNEFESLVSNMKVNND